MKRVLITSSAFKLSAPGFDVTTAAAANIAFDGFNGVAYNGVYLMGIIQAHYVNANLWAATVNFGKTFSSNPTCLVKPLDPYDGNGILRDYSASNNYNGDYANVSYGLSSTSLYMQCAFSGSTYLSQLSFAYLICQV